MLNYILEYADCLTARYIRKLARGERRAKKRMKLRAKMRSNKPNPSYLGKLARRINRARRMGKMNLEMSVGAAGTERTVPSADEAKKIKTLLDAKQDVEALVRKGERLIGSIKSNIKSSAESKLWFTLKIFPSNDRTLNGWDVDNIHDEMLKLAFEADDQWASAFNVHYLQLMEWCRKNNVDKFDLDFEDVLFVQNLKDSRGNDVPVERINRICSTMGYTPVTPGFWLKERDADGNLKPLCKWFATIFPNYKELRSRARGITTTPMIAPLNKGADGKRIRYFLTNLEATGQEGADGGNDYSADLLEVLDVSQPIWQGRVHTPFCNRNIAGFQAKGQWHAADVWVVKEGTGYRRVYKNEVDDWKRNKSRDASFVMPELIPAVFVHYDNIKGKLKDHLEQIALRLEGDKVHDLNDIWYGMYMNDVPEENRVFLGGVIAEDNLKASSSVSWQDTILRSPKNMNAQEKEWRAQLEKSIKRLYRQDNQVIDTLFAGDKTLSSAAKALGGLNPRRVESIVFGAGRKMKTKYCEQVDLPENYCVMNLPKKSKDLVVDTISGTDGGEVKFPVIALTGQPQLYHHSLVTNRVVSHEVLKEAFEWANRILENDTRPGVNPISREAIFFYGELLQYMVASPSTPTQEELKAVRDRIRSIWISLDASPNLIWMNKKTQDRLQRDSDGDRILYSLNKTIVEGYRLHEEAIRSLPMPRPEVSKKTPLDGDQEVINCKPFSYDGNADLKRRCLNYVCAPNQGQGPTGLGVNLCSAVLAHIHWYETNDGWGPDPKVREMTLKFYATLVLIVQNALDRQKKPWEVLSLVRWFLMDFDKLFREVMTGGKDYPAATMDEYFCSMAFGTSKKHNSRLNKDEQYNASALKLFVCWNLNLIKFGYNYYAGSNNPERVDCFYQTMQSISDIFASTDEEAGDVDWKAIADVLAADEQEVATKWVFPDRLYGWKKEASLEVALYDAPPALNMLSQWAVEENIKVREAVGLSNSPERAIYNDGVVNDAPEFLDMLGKDSAGIFTMNLAKAYQRAKAGLNNSMTQSEFYTNRGENDANHFLDLLKDALRDVEFDSKSKNVAWAALLGQGGKKEKSQAVEALSRLFHAIWVDQGYDAWLVARQPLTALAKQCASGLLLEKMIESEEENLATLLLGALNVKTASDRNKEKAVKVQELLAALYHDSKTVMPSDLSVVKGVGEVAVRKVTEAFAKVTMSTASSHWSELIWSDWMPALAVQADLAVKSDLKRKYFVEGNGLNGLLALVQNPGNVVETMMPLYTDMFHRCMSEHSATLEKDDDFNLLVKACNHYSLDMPMFLAGFFSSRGLVPKARDLMAIGVPFMQALRLRRLIEIQSPDVDSATLERLIRQLMFTERDYVYYDEEGNMHTEVDRRLNGRLDYPVSTAMVGEIAGNLAKECSFYLLMPAKSLWIAKDGTPRLTQTKRWIAHDRMQYLVNKVDPVEAIKLELAEQYGVGHIFSCSELNLLKLILDQGQEKPELSAYLKAKVDNSELYAQFKFTDLDTAKDENLNALIANEVCFPYHWGGNAKFKNSPWGMRSSIYRPLWRYLMSNITPVGSGSEESVKLMRFEEFEKYADASLIPGGKKAKLDTSGGISFKDALVKAIATNQGRSGQRTPSCNPVGPLLISNSGEEIWTKVPKSPAQDMPHHILFSDGSQLIAGLNVSDKKLFRFITGKDGSLVEDCLEKFNHTKYIRSSIRANGDVVRMNGMRCTSDVLSLVLSELGELESIDNTLEFVLGLLHCTSIVDSYVISNFEQHKARVGNKTPSALRRIVKMDHPLSLVQPSKAYLYRLIDINRGGDS